MGSFMGHAFPGSIFIIIGIWWMVQTLRRYFDSKNSNVPFSSTVTFKLKRFPIEAVCKVLLITIGLIAELALHNKQHATMYAFFGLTGIVDLIVFFNTLPIKDLDYVSLSLALIMEAILFKYHLFGRDTLNVVLHHLLIFVILTTFVVTLLEMKFKNVVTIPLFRSYLLILQGTWFYQVGCILYKNPFSEPWKSNDKHSLMNTGLVFTWHCGIIFIAFIITVCVFSILYRRKEPTIRTFDQSNSTECETELLIEE
ncbi:transmembrane protein 45B-like [Mytilus galloprovincialis]|uniref:transmembrane protein 45B-like n=1 Tax=Mytilus galloprovincialis TaxID=29158 RepID=UPI003F7CBA4B